MPELELHARIAHLTPSGRTVSWFKGGPRRGGRWSAEILISSKGQLRWPLVTQVGPWCGGPLLYWNILQQVHAGDWILRVKGPAVGLSQETAQITSVQRVREVDNGDVVTYAALKAPAYAIGAIPWGELLRTEARRDCPWAAQRLDMLGITLPERQRQAGRTAIHARA